MMWWRAISNLLIERGQGLGLLSVAKIAFAIEAITKVRVDVRTPGDLSKSFRAKTVAEAQQLGWINSETGRSWIQMETSIDENHESSLQNGCLCVAIILDFATWLDQEFSENRRRLQNDDCWSSLPRGR